MKTGSRVKYNVVPKKEVLSYLYLDWSWGKVTQGSPSQQFFLTSLKCNTKKNSSGLPFVHARALGGFGGVYNSSTHTQKRIGWRTSLAKSSLQKEKSNHKGKREKGKSRAKVPRAESFAKRRSNEFLHESVSGKFGMRLLSESSLIHFRGPGKYSTVHRSPPFRLVEGVLIGLKVPVWKGRLISKESHQKFLW